MTSKTTRQRRETSGLQDLTKLVNASRRFVVDLYNKGGIGLVLAGIGLLIGFFAVLLQTGEPTTKYYVTLSFSVLMVLVGAYLFVREKFHIDLFSHLMKPKDKISELVEEIRKDLTDKPVSVSLMSCKRLATLTDNASAVSWLDKESQGYWPEHTHGGWFQRPIEGLPQYRVVNTSLVFQAGKDAIPIPHPIFIGSPVCVLEQQLNKSESVIRIVSPTTPEIDTLLGLVGASVTYQFEPDEIRRALEGLKVKLNDFVSETELKQMQRTAEVSLK